MDQETKESFIVGAKQILHKAGIDFVEDNEDDVLPRESKYKKRKYRKKSDEDFWDTGWDSDEYFD